MSSEGGTNEASEERVERLAKTLYDAAVTQAREAAAKHEMQLERVTAVFEVAVGESDRSAAILLFALAEDLMLSCMEQHFNLKVPGGWKSVHEGNGLLATASDRLMLLQLLSWIRPTTAADIRLMKSVRNRFAHHADVRSFEDNKIKGMIASMNDRERAAFSVYPEVERAEWRPLRGRELFLIRGCMTVAQLNVDLAIGPNAREYKVAPEHLEPEFDALPESFKAARRLMADISLRFIPPR